MADDVKKTLVQIDVDQAASKRVQAETAAIRKQIEGLQKTVQAMGRDLGVTDQRLAKYGKGAQESGKRIDTLAERIEKADKAVMRLDSSMADSKGAKTFEANIKAAAQRSELYGDVESRTLAVSSFARTAGAGNVATALTGGADFLGAVEGVQRMKAELPALAAQLGTSTAALGALGLGLVGLNIGLDRLKKSISATGDVTRNMIEANRKYADVVATGTTAEVKAAIKTEEDRQKALRLEKEPLDQFIQATKEADGVAGAFMDLNNALEANYGGVENVKGRLKEINNELGSSADAVDRMEGALGGAIVAANDAAAAEEALADARRTESQQRIAVIERDLKADMEARERSRTMTDEQRQERLDAIQAELAYEEQLTYAIQQKLEAGTLDAKTASEAINASLMKQVQLEQEQNTLEGYIRVLTEARAKTERMTEGMEALTSSASSSAASLQKYADEQAKVNATRNLKAVQDAEKYALDQVNKLADHYKAMAKLDSAYYEQRHDIIEDMRADLGDIATERLDTIQEYNQESIQLSDEHYKRLSEIQRRAQDDIRSASLKLDAVQINEAKKRADEEIRVEEDQYSTEKRQREQNFRDQLRQFDRERQTRLQEGQKALRDLERQHARERQEQESAFREESRRANAQRAMELKHQQQQYAMEDQLRKQQYAVLQSAAGAHQTRMLNTTLAGTMNIETAFGNSLSRMASAVTARLSVPTVTTAVGSSMAHLPKGYARGGTPPLFEDVVVGDRGPEIARFTVPTTIYPNGTMPPGGFNGGDTPLAGAQITIYVDGSRDPQQTAYVTRRELEDMVRTRH
jgi:hypothetical protein